MLKPNIIQIPDYTSYIGKTFVVTEDFYWFEYLGVTKEEYDDYTKNEDWDNEFYDEIEEKLYPVYDDEVLMQNLYVGTTFTIKKIKNNIITIELNRVGDALDKVVANQIESLIQETEQSIKKLDTIIGWWTNEEDKFYVDKKSVWNQNGEGHCINTGFNGIPKDHPDKYGMAKPHFYNGKYVNDDSIMTLDYKHKDKRLNIYSYQSGNPEFYSKTCYEFIRLGELQDIEKYKSSEFYKECAKKQKKRKDTLNLNMLNAIKFAEV